MKTKMPVMYGKTDSQKINALIKVVSELCEDTEPKKEENTLPEGTIILRKDVSKNAGMTYGTWLMLPNDININGISLKAYIRVQEDKK
ncbi:MAG: hypothetical protein E7267_03900 [Lachnospiraceae bacterium]|nr:hypothetical protein [Lachnospiraceae bacterium]